MPSRDGKIRILSADGGGVRGLITLQVLAALEKRANKPLWQLFDLIVGTSTGGLIALALSREGYPLVSQVQQLYRQLCPQIFNRTAKQRIVSVGQLAGPKYSNETLYRCAQEMLGGKLQLRHCNVPAMVTAYDIKARAPKFYSTWTTPDVLMIDAAMSTTAAPTYFAPWHDNVDGGVCDNNPALSGVVEACRHFDCSVRDVICVSVGTGSDMQSYRGSDAARWGLLSWVEPLSSIFTDGTSELHAYHLARLMRDEDVYRFQCRVDGPCAELDNADVDNLAMLEAIGAQLADSLGNRMAELVPRLEGA